MTLSAIIMGLLIGQGVPAKADPALVEALEEVEINQSDSAGDGVEQGFRMTFNAQRSPDRRPDYGLLQNEALKPGSRVVVSVTLEAQPRVLMDGIITHQQLTFDTALGESWLTVIGTDLTVLMDLVEQVKSHQGMQHEQVVRHILGQYASLGVQPKIVTPETSWPTQPPQHMPFQSATDLGYLRELAALYGHVFFLRPGPQPLKSTAYWGPPEFQAEPQKALTVNIGSDTNVETLTFAYDALAPSQLYRALAQDGGATATLVETLKSKQALALAKQGALTANGTFVRKSWLRYSGPDAGEPGARAQALVDRSSRMAITGRGTLDVLQYGGVLMAPGMVGVRGAGSSYDGAYYLKTVKHRIRGGEYKQDFTITREGPGSLVQRVKV
ncbi:MAG TPA: hypothetical protein VF897_16620 [Roseiflexaceae bacterium]